MNRLYAGLSGLLVVGGVVALVFQAWVLGAVLLVIGAIGLWLELRANRGQARSLPVGSQAVLTDQRRAAQPSDVDLLRTDRHWNSGS